MLAVHQHARLIVAIPCRSPVFIPRPQGNVFNFNIQSTQHHTTHLEHTQTRTLSLELLRALKSAVFQVRCVGWERSACPDLIPFSARLCQLFHLVFCGLHSWSVQFLRKRHVISFKHPTTRASRNKHHAPSIHTNAHLDTQHAAPNTNKQHTYNTHTTRRHMRLRLTRYHHIRFDRTTVGSGAIGKIRALVTHKLSKIRLRGGVVCFRICMVLDWYGGILVVACGVGCGVLCSFFF